MQLWAFFPRKSHEYEYLSIKLDTNYHLRYRVIRLHHGIDGHALKLILSSWESPLTQSTFNIWNTTYNLQFKLCVFLAISHHRFFILLWLGISVNYTAFKVPLEAPCTSLLPYITAKPNLWQILQSHVP